MEGAKGTLESIKKVFRVTQEKLTAAQNTNTEKSNYILYLEQSLKDAQTSIMVLAKDQEKLTESLNTQKDALKTILLGHEAAISDAGDLMGKIINLSGYIEKVTKKKDDHNEDVERVETEE